jgi:hypothetical protein
MNTHASQSKPIVDALLLAAGTVLALFFWESHQGFSLWDEGFLWYGAQRVIAGEVPIRDFMSYDPGRYYWSAALMSLWGDSGIIALRVATAVFQAMGLFAGLALISLSTAKPDRLFSLVAAITLAVWMSPPYRLFDNSLPYVLIGALAFLVQQPSARRFFLTGMTVGLVAVFGRNHGVYGVAASLGAMTFFALGRGNDPGVVKAFAIWSAGVVIGFIPVLAMVAVVPGFALAFWESIRFLFEIQATNLPLPIPWPWRIPYWQGLTVVLVHGVLVGLLFIAVIVSGVLGIAWSFRQRLRNKPVPAALLASALLALPYAHYAYSRADLDHLGPGIPPFLIACLVLLASQPSRIKWPLAALLCGASLLVMLPTHPGWECFAISKCVEADVAGNRLRIDPRTAAELEMLNKLADRFAPGGRSFVAAPFWPGAYAVLGRKSPMWEIYALSPRSEAFQQAEIERIEAANPGFAVINDYPLDRRDELRFRNTHPMIDQYIRDHFEPLTGYAQRRAYRVYRSRQAPR